MTTVPMEPVAAPEPRWRALRGTNVADRLYRTVLTTLALVLPLLLLALVGEPVVDLRADPVLADLCRAAPPGHARLDPVPERRLLRQLAVGRGSHSRDYDRSLHRRGLPRGAAGRPRQSAGGGARYGRDPVGGR